MVNSHFFCRLYLVASSWWGTSMFPLTDGAPLSCCTHLHFSSPTHISAPHVCPFDCHALHPSATSSCPFAIFFLLLLRSAQPWQLLTFHKASVSVTHASQRPHEALWRPCRGLTRHYGHEVLQRASSCLGWVCHNSSRR